MGQQEEAIVDYDEAIRLNPKIAEAYINRAEEKNKMGEWAAAIADCNEAIRLKPDFAETYLNRGNATAALKRKDEARKDFGTALNLARNANDANIVAQAEQALRGLDDAED